MNKQAKITITSIIVFIVLVFTGMVYLSNYLEKKEQTEEAALWNDPEITLEEYNKLEIGMELKEVNLIIGSAGDLIDEAGTRMMRMYSGDIPNSWATLSFEYGELSSKIQLGLDE